jgi:hypothetical protein
MIFKIILSIKHKVGFKLLTYLVVLSIILSMSSCTTTETLRVESESITYSMNYEITNVIMEDGKVIDLRDKSPRYAEEWDNNKNVILYTNDTVWISEKRYRVSDEIKIIELDKVRWVTLESIGKNVEVTVTTKSGTRYKGGLLSVTDNKISLSNKKLKNNVTVIEKDSIKKVLIHGESNVLTGLGYGALIGAGIGAIIGYASGDDHPIEPGKIGISFTAEEKALGGSFLVGLLGGLIGLIVGLASSTPDKTIVIKSDDDYNKLKRYIKHPSYEPLIYRYNEEEKNK